MPDIAAIPPHRVTPRPSARRRCRHARGFTLIEALMASVILTVSVAALMQAISAGQMQTYQALHEARATSLNEALLDELLSVEYSQLDQWHGYGQLPDAIADAHDNLHDAPYQRFEQTVAVEPHTVDLPGLGTVTGKRITLTLRDDKAGQWLLHRFVANPAPGTGDAMEELDP